MKPLAVVLFLACLTAGAFGDVVHLSDGSTLEGDIKRTRDGWTLTDASGKVTTLAAADVKSIELKTASTGADTAAYRLTSLRHALANVSDPKQAIERYKNFISQNHDAAVAADAEKDLAVWQDRLARGLVKAGDQWVTKEQVAQLQARANQTAAQLVPMIDAGQLHEALKVLEPALALSPQNPALLYLKGEILFRQDQLVPARNAFQSAAGELADHGPTHNNIAVILWRTRSQMPALLEYDKAMLASAVNQTILDNVAEALHSLPREHQQNDLTKKVVRHFNEQNASLEKTMAQRGLYHWGTAWISEAEFRQLSAADKAVSDKVDALKTQATQLQTRITAIDTNIADEQNLMAALLQQSTFQDPQTGRMVMLPPPQRYYELQRDVMALKTERVAKVKELQGIPRQIADAERSRPARKYSGVQKVFDASAAPGVGPTTAPSTRPATQPSTPPVPTHPGGADFGQDLSAGT